jgi:hypothetical protein
VWNWEKQEWEARDVINESTIIVNPDDFLGPQNAVRLRLLADEIGGYVRIGRLAVAQSGTF